MSLWQQGNMGSQAEAPLSCVKKKEKFITDVDNPLEMVTSEMLISILPILPSHRFSHSAATFFFLINPIPSDITAFPYVMNKDSMPESFSTRWICFSRQGDFHHYELRKKRKKSLLEIIHETTQNAHLEDKLRLTN